jgi:hypothetical protein
MGRNEILPGTLALLIFEDARVRRRSGASLYTTSTADGFRDLAAEMLRQLRALQDDNDALILG